MNKTPCSISDGPQTPEDVPGYVEQDGDAAYDEQRQCKLDTFSQELVDDIARARRIAELNETLANLYRKED